MTPTDAPDDLAPPMFLVQHCNARTGYELIVHPSAPSRCSECRQIEAISTGQTWGGWNPLAYGTGG